MCIRDSDFYSLGLGDGIKISAYHDLGIYELMESIDHLFSEKKADDESIKFSIIGRPNVGKSTIFNSMLGDSISIVDSTPGTTRDSVDSKLNYNEDLFTIVDTAGIRRKGKIGKEIEYFSVIRTISSVSESNISLLVIDSTEQITLQDQHIAGLIIQSGNGCVVAMNKVDLLNKKFDDSKLIEILKFFPAEVLGGMKMLKALQGPFPDCHFFPTGGINQDNANKYLSLSNIKYILQIINRKF